MIYYNYNEVTNMTNEEKIIELTKRIEILEAAEKKRIAKRKIKIAYELTKIIILITIFLTAYLYVNNKVIKPYKEKVDFINEKVDNFGNLVEDKFNGIKNIFK